MDWYLSLIHILMKLSQLFGVTLDELVTGAEPQLKVETPPVMVSPSMPGRKIAGPYVHNDSVSYYWH